MCVCMCVSPVLPVAGGGVLKKMVGSVNGRGDLNWPKGYSNIHTIEHHVQ